MPAGAYYAEAINEAFGTLPHPKMAVTTEKDAARLTNIKGLDGDVAQALYQMPIRVRILKDAARFDQLVTDYVTTTLKQ